jgi:hypothetical protein
MNEGGLIVMPYPHGSTHGCSCLPRPPVRHCRQEAKELLVQGDPVKDGTNTTGTLVGANAANVTTTRGTGQAIIGGGCCVQLSVEYMPVNLSLQDQVCRVAVEVQDSAGSLLAWSKQFKEGYHVKECIITTYPGAKLLVIASNAIARVRWCEIFSC